MHNDYRPRNLPKFDFQNVPHIFAKILSELDLVKEFPPSKKILVNFLILREEIPLLNLILEVLQQKYEAHFAPSYYKKLLLQKNSYYKRAPNYYKKIKFLDLVINIAAYRLKRWPRKNSDC